MRTNLKRMFLAGLPLVGILLTAPVASAYTYYEYSYSYPHRYHRYHRPHRRHHHHWRRYNYDPYYSYRDRDWSRDRYSYYRSYPYGYREWRYYE